MPRDKRRRAGGVRPPRVFRFGLLLAAAIFMRLAGASDAYAAGQQVDSGGDGAKPAAAGQSEAARFAEAEAKLRAQIAERPDSASVDIHYLLAYTLMREDKAADSLAEYTRAAKLRAPSAGDLKSVAMDYVLLGSYADAERWIVRSVTMNPEDADAWYVRGRIDYERKRYVAAVEDFTAALKLAPKTVKAEDNLGLAYEGLNRSEDAASAYRQAIEWQRGTGHPSAQPLLNLATLLIHENNLDQALPLLVEATGIAPGDPKTHEQLGQLYLKKERFGDAQKEFQSAVAVSPDSAALHFLLGQAYRRQGMQEQAKAELARAAALSGTHSSAN